MSFESTIIPSRTGLNLAFLSRFDDGTLSMSSQTSAKGRSAQIPLNRFVNGFADAMKSSLFAAKRSTEEEQRIQFINNLNPKLETLLEKKENEDYMTVLNWLITELKERINNPNEKLDKAITSFHDYLKRKVSSADNSLLSRAIAGNIHNVVLDALDNIIRSGYKFNANETLRFRLHEVNHSPVGGEYDVAINLHKSSISPYLHGDENIRQASTHMPGMTVKFTNRDQNFSRHNQIKELEYETRDAYLDTAGLEEGHNVIKSIHNPRVNPIKSFTIQYNDRNAPIIAYHFDPISRVADIHRNGGETKVDKANISAA